MSVVSWGPLVALKSLTHPVVQQQNLKIEQILDLCTILRHSISTFNIIHHIALDLVDNFKGDTRCGRAQPQLVIIIIYQVGHSLYHLDSFG